MDRGGSGDIETPLRASREGAAMSEARRVRSARAHGPDAARQWRAALGSIAALVACIGLLGAVLSGTFRVREVQVVGANLPVESIVEAAGVTGANLFEVRSDVVASRVSAIREIVVTRVDTSFPDRVVIYARLRATAVAWQSGKTLYELDANGEIVRAVSQTTLPIVQGARGQGPPGPGVIQAVRYAAQTLPPLPRGPLAGFRLDPRLGLVITGRSGWTAEVGRGTPETMLIRVATLASFLQKIRNRPEHLIFVDLRPRTPYARFGTA